MLPNNRFKPRMAAILVTASAVAAPLPASAVPLQDLLDGGSIVFGDATFSDWQLDPFSDADPGPGPDFTQIDVTAFQSGNILGLRYTANDQWSVEDDGFIDSFFSYSLTTGSTPITGVELELLDFEITGIGGSINLIDDISDPTGGPLAATAVFSDNLTGNAQLLDSSPFASVLSLEVESAVLLAGDFPGDEIVLNTFEQRFVLDADADGAIPEPATAGLFGIATAVIASATRRRRTRTPIHQ